MTTPRYTVSAIPYVCAARPGMLTTEDLPPILPAAPARQQLAERAGGR